MPTITPELKDELRLIVLNSGYRTIKEFAVEVSDLIDRSVKGIETAFCYSSRAPRTLELIADMMHYAIFSDCGIKRLKRKKQSINLTI